MNKTEVKVPDIGGYDDVPVIDVLVADGEHVQKDQPLLVLESDKATMEVPSPAAGTVRGLRLKVGDKVSKGTVICELEGEETRAAAPQAPSAAQPPSTPAQAERNAQRGAPPASSATPMSSVRVEVKIPDIGDYTGVPVIDVLVADGDAVEKDQPLLVLESDKATMEVPSPASGTVRDLRLKLGDKVSQGDAVCVLETSASGEDAGDNARPVPERTQAVPPLVQPSSSSGPRPGARETRADRASSLALANASSSSGRAGMSPADALPDPAPPYAGPATRKFARELGVDLAQLKGSGPRGRILIEDVQAFVKTRLASSAKGAAPSSTGGTGIPPIPAVDFALFGAVETKPLARIRKLSAAHLSRAWLNIPHVTQTIDADITELEAFRKQQSAELAASGGPKLTLLPILMKAVACALKAFPEFNASLSADGESLVMKQYCHIGFAADTPNGLVVPVVRDVWGKGIAELSAECAALAKKARDGKLKPDEMKGGCFSISSLGGIGGGYFTPIVNAPEVGILGVSKAEIKPVWDGKTFQPRLLCPLSLSYDHRVIDGAYAARFIVHLSRLLADVRLLLL
ncbi:dihydrolipoyllysine-residue acetyltransferase [Sinimarinibacterium thermocellulolyticum]|uniref:Acetyltransferase component of pyruvate dehydrogenase complex n=1 Tax=Sinimarinibacterium thermocellulolyticum TaxID=3170016 RepID=A0ABV2AE14_9GAMM